MRYHGWSLSDKTPSVRILSLRVSKEILEGVAILHLLDSVGKWCSG